MLAQTPEALERVLGDHGYLARILLGAQAITLEGLRADFATRPVDLACPMLNDYLIASMGSLPDEVLRILFLDATHRLIADEQMHSGSVRHLDLYPRTIFRRAMEHGATGIILAHNHPSGDSAPSDDDIVATRRLAEIGAALDIKIIDHIVVTSGRVQSIAAAAVERLDPSTTSSCVLRDSYGAGGPLTSVALENARRTLRRRKYRNELIGSKHLFGEPAWEMLLTVFIHSCEGRKIATNTLCKDSWISPSGALRLVHKLCDAKLLMQIADPNDGRRHFVELTSPTTQRMVTYFGAGEV